MSELGWGLMGTARINRAIIEAVRQSPRNRLRAIASRSQGTADAYAAEWQIPAAFAPYEALLADPGVDVVYIGLPNTLHVEWTVRALEAGKHVLCEKPLALDADGIDRIIAASARAKRVAAEAFMYRHHPLTAAAVAAVREGRIGDLRLIRGAFTYQLTHRTPDIRTDASLGGGSLWDVGCYPVSYACLVAGAAPVEVFGWQDGAGSNVDLTFAGQMHFPGGVVAQFDSGFRTTFRSEMELVGSEGVLRVARPFKAAPQSQLVLSRGDETVALDFRADPPYVGEVDDFAAAVLDNRPHPLPLEESRRTARVLVALHESARRGVPVRL
jgi:predicted dehydrogenase